MKLGKSDISIGQQVFAMHSLFPQFKYKREHQRATWVGFLQPTDKSPQYKVKISYPYPYPPKAWIIFPAIHPNAPHRYSDKSLCLYYPKDRSWHTQKLVAETILPWTAEWLAFYEIWCLTRQWYGEEVQHTGKK